MITTTANETQPTSTYPYAEQQRQLTLAIMQTLGERGVPVYCMIHRALKVLGHLKVLAGLKAALDIEAEGGMLTKDGSRRRTPGGTFFFVLKAGCTREEAMQIWPYPYIRKRMQREQLRVSAEKRKAGAA